MSDELSNCPVCNSYSANPCSFCGHDRTKRYSVVVADPPYTLNNQGTRASPAYEGKQREEKRYETMSLDELKKMGAWLCSLLTDDCFLFLWAPHSLVLDGQASALANAWDFLVKQEVVWVKTDLAGDGLAIGLGNYARISTEPMLLCRRGKARVARKDMPNVIFAPRREHSRKPRVAMKFIEELTGADRFLELFARERYSERWVTYGDQAPRNAVEVKLDGEAVSGQS